MGTVSVKELASLTGWDSHKINSAIQHGYIKATPGKGAKGVAAWAIEDDEAERVSDIIRSGGDLPKVTSPQRLRKKYRVGSSIRTPAPSSNNGRWGAFSWEELLSLYVDLEHHITPTSDRLRTELRKEMLSREEH
jgi:hypothetical protein